MRRVAAVLLLLALPVTAAPSLADGVRRDSRGIPYIKARNEHDLFYLQGYLTAADRLFQMELLRRTARGELAEIFGKDALEDDKRRRTYGFAQLADGAAALQAPDYGAALKAYAEGVNAWVSEHEGKLPVEFGKLGIGFRPWVPADTLLIGYLFAEDLSTSWPTDLAMASMTGLPEATLEMFFPSFTKDDLYLVGDGKAAKPRPTGGIVISSVVPSLESHLEASNNWVISGARTTTGKPMLANDPHLAPSAPGIWHMVNLDSPTIHAAGVTAPGVPGVLLGHNELIAWGCTNVAPDVQDLYRETFDGTRYQTPAGWSEAGVREERIAVKGSEPVVVKVLTTRHGPVVVDGYALQWTILNPTQAVFDAFYRLNRARNWAEFLAALRRYAGPAQNFVYADIEGNIGWYAAGRVPMRASGDGSRPLDGATSEGAWAKFIPFESMPHLYNPPGGVIVTANQRIAGPAYPFHLASGWPSPYRARRIAALLAKKAKLSVDDLRAIQGDTYAWSDALFAVEVVKMAKGKSEAPWPELAAMLGKWDGLARADSSVLPVVMAMRDSFRRRMLAAALGDERAKRYRWPNGNAAFDRLITERPAAFLPKELPSYEALVAATYADARGELAKSLGDDPAKWTLANLRKYRWPHPLGFTVETPATSAGSSTPVNAGAAVSMRFLADLSNWDDTRLSLPLGESGDPASPHWKDQLESWLSVQPAPFVFTSEAVAKATSAASQ
jgi:penicillin amidase